MKKYIHCHRKACQAKVPKEEAFWNISTLEWYCNYCARLINDENPPSEHFPDILCVPYSHAVPNEDL